MTSIVGSDILINEFWEASKRRKQACLDAVIQTSQFIDDIFDEPLKSIATNERERQRKVDPSTHDGRLEDKRARARYVDTLTTIREMQLDVLHRTILRKEDELQVLAEEKKAIVDEVDQFVNQSSSLHRGLPELPSEILSKIFGMLAMTKFSSGCGARKDHPMFKLLRDRPLTNSWWNIITADIPVVFHTGYTIAADCHKFKGFHVMVEARRGDMSKVPRTPSPTHHYLLLQHNEEYTPAILQKSWRHLVIEPYVSVLTLLEDCRASLPDLHSLVIEDVYEETPCPSSSEILIWNQHLPKTPVASSAIHAARVDTHNLPYCSPWFANLRELRLGINRGTVKHLNDLQETLRFLPSSLVSLNIWLSDEHDWLVGAWGQECIGVHLRNLHLRNLRHLGVKDFSHAQIWHLLKFLLSPSVTSVSCQVGFTSDRRGNKGVATHIFKTMTEISPKIAKLTVIYCGHSNFLVSLSLQLELGNHDLSLPRKAEETASSFLTLMADPGFSGTYSFRELEHLKFHISGKGHRRINTIKSILHCFTMRYDIPGVKRLRSLKLQADLTPNGYRLQRDPEADRYMRSLRMIIPTVSVDGFRDTAELEECTRFEDTDHFTD